MDLSNITALEYIVAENEAFRNGEGVAQLRRLRKRLDRLPHIRARLATEFLAMAATAVERRQEPDRLAFLGLLFTEIIFGIVGIIMLPIRIDYLIVLLFVVIASGMYTVSNLASIPY